MCRQEAADCKDSGVEPVHSAVSAHVSAPTSGSRLEAAALEVPTCVKSPTAGPGDEVSGVGSLVEQPTSVITCQTDVGLQKIKDGGIVEDIPATSNLAGSLVQEGMLAQGEANSSLCDALPSSVARVDVLESLCADVGTTVGPGDHLLEVLSSKDLKAVVDFGGIPNPTLGGFRSSERIRSQPNADATQLERAMLNARVHNDYCHEGKILNHSFLDFDEEDICARADRLGISLGKNKEQKLASVKSIKNVEFNRSLTILKKSDVVTYDSADGPSMLLSSRISSLAEDLEAEEAVGDDDFDLNIPLITFKNKRKKKVYDLSAVRRSARVKSKNHI
jgi:hypothetical protein